MLTSKFKARLRVMAEHNGKDSSLYSDFRLAKLERDFINQGGTDEELHEFLIKDVLYGDQKTELDSFGKSICPNCGKNSLVHEGGCETCRDCGYSRCG